ncbi:hypothetical protein PITCH_A1670002 [uncultured Desulfobacterium sp.]|uniref:Uncharacterized protein n=1 Tax=uncultured Desulfobacterium sp. TaxID=201089 RepID=A0A445MUI5_9BACT|nr:hypothetical protein PITCH_A1670002 [uncultured Desulfobacterium sp.]
MPGQAYQVRHDGWRTFYGTIKVIALNLTRNLLNLKHIKWIALLKKPSFGPIANKGVF